MCCETMESAYVLVMSNHITNTHLTHSSLVKSQIQRLNPFIINHFNSFNLMIWKETNVIELWLEYFSFLKKKKPNVWQKWYRKHKGSNQYSNVHYRKNKMSYQIFSLCTGNICFDLGFYKYFTTKVFYRQNRNLGDTIPSQYKYNKFFPMLNIFIVSCLKTYNNNQ